MKKLYFECNMGAAGDMMAASLLEIHPDPDSVIEKLNNMGLEGVAFAKEAAEKCGVGGTHFRVIVNGEEEESIDADVHDHDHDHDHEHEHSHTHDHEHVHEHSHDHEHHHHHTYRGLHEIRHLVSDLSLPDPVKSDVLAVYDLIAEAEAHVHGSDIDNIHFHEVGSLDAVADISAVCLLIHELGPDSISASPVHVGSGMVKCAHGILPVPAPATAYILNGVPSYGGSVKGELCTPTGAALLKHFAESFGPQPVMSVQKIGYGMGKKDFEQANCVRAMLGESNEVKKDGKTDTIIELVCNLDDMTPEEIGFATEQLLKAGAPDVFTSSIGMKKNRPATMLTVLCRPEQEEEMVKLIFRYTATLGVRESVCRRFILDRQSDTVETSEGAVRVKSVSGWGTCRKKAEYDDLKIIAENKGISLRNAEKLI